jgi:hypothetical protein
VVVILISPVKGAGPDKRVAVAAELRKLDPNSDRICGTCVLGGEDDPVLRSR